MKLKYGPLALQDLSGLSWFPFVEPVIRIEEYHKDGRYVVRAELPGIDPVKDVAITTLDGTLHVTVVRMEEDKEDGRTEFRYGTYHRAVALPPGVKEDTITATYTDGILEISMKVGDPKATGRTIPVAVTNGHPKPAKKN